MKRTLLSLQQAVQILEPYKEIILSEMQKSFEQHLSVRNFISEEIGFYPLKPRTKAGLISEFVESNISQAFAEIEKVTSGVFNGVFGLNVENLMFIRFKKMNKDFKTGNIDTIQQRKLQNQSTLNGFPDKPTIIFAGYIPNSTWMNVIGYYLACWDGERLLWYDEFGNVSYEQLSLDIKITDEKVHKEIESIIKVRKDIVTAKGNIN